MKKLIVFSMVLGFLDITFFATILETSSLFISILLKSPSVITPKISSFFVTRMMYILFYSTW